MEDKERRTGKDRRKSWHSMINWLEARIGLDQLIQSTLRAYAIPQDTGIFRSLGFVAVVAFFAQALTGIFLLTFYIPHPDHAFESIQSIMNTVPYGWLFRLIHVVGANLLVAVLFLHLIVVYYRGTYKKPRELTWLSGGLMFILVFLFCITGYLLPWNQLSYWSTTVLTTIFTFLPFVGEAAANFLRGGEYVTATTLSRFFAFHVAFLPFIFLLFIGLHIFLVWRIGLSSLQTSRSDEASPSTEFRREVYPEGYPYYPLFFMKDMFMVMIFFAVMFLIIAFSPTFFFSEGSYVKADPFITPEAIRPPWYFLFSYKVFRVVPNKFLGISIQLILLAVFLAWPFLDTKEEKDIRKRPLLLGIFYLVVTVWIIFTIWGAY